MGIEKMLDRIFFACSLSVAISSLCFFDVMTVVL